MKSDSTPKISTGLTEQELAVGSWLARHRAQLERLHLFFWIAVASMSVLIFLLVTINWLAHISETRQIEAGLTQSLIKIEALRAVESIQLGTPTVIRRSADSVDVILLVVNPNPTSAAKATIGLQLGGQTLGSQAVTFAPNQERYVVSTRVPYSGSSLPSASARVDSIDWTQTPTFTETEYNWQFANAQFAYTDDGQTRITLDLVNPTPFTAREAEVVIRLQNGAGEVAATDRIVLQSVAADSTQELQFVWPGRLSSNLSTSVGVQIDYSLNGGDF